MIGKVPYLSAGVLRSALLSPENSFARRLGEEIRFNGGKGSSSARVTLPCMKSLKDQQAAFHRGLQSQSIVAKRIVHAAADPALPSTPITEEQFGHLRPDVTETGSQRHLFSYVYSIINFLKLIQRPVTCAEILSALHVDISKNADLEANLLSNPKIQYDPASNGTFSYKPQFVIRNKADLVSLLQKNQSDGLDYEELKDSFSKLDAVLEELVSARLVIVLRGDKKDSGPKAIFWNEMPNVVPVDSDLRDIWNELPLPHELDLQQELKAAGLKGLEVDRDSAEAQRRLKRSEGGKGSRGGSTKRKRPVKITNTHLEGLVDFEAIKRA